jgi:hypothetical protein
LIKKDGETEANFLKLVMGVVTFAVVVTCAPWLYAFYDLPMSSDPGAWGVFGDYIGGVLSTFLSACGFIGVIYTVAMQRKAVSAQMANIKQDKDIRDDEVYSNQALACLDEAIRKITSDGAVYTDRVAWLECARLILTARELAGRIQSHSVNAVYFAAEKIYRSKFSSLLDPGILTESMQPSFFDGVNWDAVMQNKSAEAVEPLSVYVIYSFISWQKGELDILDSIAEEIDVERVSRRYFGARMYLSKKLKPAEAPVV